MLLKFCSGSNKPVLQIERKYYLNKLCQFNDVPEDSAIKCWVQSTWSKKHATIQYNEKFIFIPTESMIFDDDVTQRHFSYHSKLYYYGINLCTAVACADFKYDNSWIYLNESFFNIQAILCDKSNIIYIVGQKLSTSKLFENMHSYTFTDEIRIMKITRAVRQCINMHVKSNNVRYISICKVQTQID